MRTIAVIILAIGLCLSSACSLQPVAPWERERLADPRMSPEAGDLVRAMDAKIYFSKEAGRAAGAAEGGGCGCN